MCSPRRALPSILPSRTKTSPRNSIVTGQPVTTATQLLLGPVVRGMTVSPAPSEAGEQPR